MDCLCKLQAAVIEEDTNEVGPCQKPDHVAAALWLPMEADQSYIPSWHLKYDIFCCVYSLAKRARETESGEKKERARQRGIAANYTMPSTLTNPSGVSFFIRCYSPHWPLLPPSLGLNGPYQDKVMLLACVMNLPPEPKGACGGLAHQHAGRVAVVTV